MAEIEVDFIYYSKIDYDSVENMSCANVERIGDLLPEDHEAYEIVLLEEGLRIELKSGIRFMVKTAENITKQFNVSLTANFIDRDFNYELTIHASNVHIFIDGKKASQFEYLYQGSTVEVLSQPTAPLIFQKVQTSFNVTEQKIPFTLAKAHFQLNYLLISNFQPH